MNQKVTEEIKIWGIVQGVGFRPMVAKVASELNLAGYVKNMGGLVSIKVSAEKRKIDEFVQRVEKNVKAPAEILHLTREVVECANFKEFRIDESSCLNSDLNSEIAMIPSDIATCEKCMEELRDKSNPRHRHPFVSCMLCGPRYTIINNLPYDRERTTMKDFPMCPKCNKEYTDINDRRYHAQTISCMDCGPILLMKSRGKQNISNAGEEDASGLLKGSTREKSDEIITNAANSILDGGIIAFKAVGGYNLVCDSTNEEAISKLREIKGRENKPFAIMYPSIAAIKKENYVDQVEEKLLTSKARPIVLLENKESSVHIGAFLPSFAAQNLLIEEVGKPLIFTSCNISSQPIITDDSEMEVFFEKEKLIEYIVYNERRILTPIDDSVMRVIDGKPQVIRRAKGYTPIPIFINENSGEEVLAVGGDLKNSFTLTKGGFAYVSQFFGDVEEERSGRLFLESDKRLESFFDINPNQVLCDKHPKYWTSIEARNMAKERGVTLKEIQHHHSHIGSVMAEHGEKGPVIGIALDGTGYGDDDNIWGGEILLCEGPNYKRLSHLKYIELLGGNLGAKEAYRPALSYMEGWIDKVDNVVRCYDEGHNSKECEEFTVDIKEIVDYSLKNRTLEKYANVETLKIASAGIRHRINTTASSSMGRLFDGVSAMLGICGENDYEGRCAMELEDLARAYLRGKTTEENAWLAFKFHKEVAATVCREAIKAREKFGVDKVALSGGVFQNKILMEESLKLLRGEGFKVLYNISVSPNDGGISLGQAYLAIVDNR